MAHSPLRVNMISETTFTVRGHGVHTAFVEMTEGLKALPQVQVRVNSFRQADITHVQTIGPYAALQLLLGRGKKVASVHVIPDSFVGSIKGAERWLGLSRRYLRWFYGRADLLLPVSEETQEALSSQLDLTKPSTVLFNTVSAARYHSTPADRKTARQRLDIDPGSFVVLSNGQIQPRKRFDIFIALAQQFPEWTFIWVGGIPFKGLGAEAGPLEELAENAPKNVVVTGVIELAEVKQYYQVADAFILASDQENHPLAVLEAAASGLPIVVRDIPQYDSAFGNEVLRGNDATFGSILQRLHDDKDYYQKAIAGSAAIAKRFDTATGAQRLLALYQKLLDNS